MVEGIKISSLPAAESADAEDVVAGVQNNTTKKFSLATILAYLQSAFTIGSGTKTGLSGILKGNGTTVGTATAGTDYQAAITAQGVLVGGGGGSVSAKTLDTSTLTNDNDHIPTSGVVKSAIDLPVTGAWSKMAALTSGSSAEVELPGSYRGILYIIGQSDRCAVYLLAASSVGSVSTFVSLLTNSDIAVSYSGKKVTITNNYNGGISIALCSLRPDNTAPQFSIVSS